VPLQYLIPFIGTFEDVQLRLGIGWGFAASARTPSSGPSEPCMGFDFPVLLLLLLLIIIIIIPPLPHLRGRLCVCAYIHLDMFFLSVFISRFLFFPRLG
jgi:hypothetical protein